MLTNVNTWPKHRFQKRQPYPLSCTTVHPATVSIELGFKEGPTKCRMEQQNKSQLIWHSWVLPSYGNQGQLGNAQTWGKRGETKNAKNIWRRIHHLMNAA